MDTKSKSLDEQKVKSSNLRFYQRRYLINSKLQVGVMLYSATVAAVVSIVNQIFRFMLSEESGPIMGIDPMILLWALSCGIIMVTVLFGFYFTNRIAGPIFRIQRHMEKFVETGEIAPFSVRKDDYFQELMIDYNKFLEKLKQLKNR